MALRESVDIGVVIKVAKPEHIAAMKFLPLEDRKTKKI